MSIPAITVSEIFSLVELDTIGAIIGPIADADRVHGGRHVVLQSLWKKLVAASKEPAGYGYGSRPGVDFTASEFQLLASHMELAAAIDRAKRGGWDMVLQRLLIRVRATLEEVGNGWMGLKIAGQTPEANSGRATKRNTKR